MFEQEIYILNIDITVISLVQCKQIVRKVVLVRKTPLLNDEYTL